MILFALAECPGCREMRKTLRQATQLPHAFIPKAVFIAIRVDDETSRTLLTV